MQAERRACARSIAGTCQVHRDRYPDAAQQPLLHAEWTKFRTVRGWVIAVIVAVLVTVLVGLFQASHSHVAPCTTGPNGPACRYVIPTGPGGESVTDTYYFVHRPLTGNGSITTDVTSLTEVAESSQTLNGRPVSTRS